MAHEELWSAALTAYEAIHGTGPSAMHFASEGHRNARHVAVAALADVTGCPCGADDLCADEIDTPERIRLREALTALVAVIGVPERVERGNSPP